MYLCTGTRFLTYYTFPVAAHCSITFYFTNGGELQRGRHAQRPRQHSNFLMSFLLLRSDPRVFHLISYHYEATSF